jgi:hypothetical protein
MSANTDPTIPGETLTDLDLYDQQPAAPDEFDAMLAGTDQTCRFIHEELCSLIAVLDGQPIARRVEGLARLCYYRGRTDGSQSMQSVLLKAFNAPIGQVPA